MRKKLRREDITEFKCIVWDHYRKHGRHNLPWRKTKNPYRILVSEIMLQQTQVERVTPYYKTFLKQFLTVRSLSRAPLSSVLRAWQGLGYNRRAKMLHEAAKEIAKRGSFPKKVTELERLPGIGPYTARAICAFAYNQNVVFVETNIRTALIHHFFRAKTSIRNGSIYGTVSDARFCSEKMMDECGPNIGFNKHDVLVVGKCTNRARSVRTNTGKSFKLRYFLRERTTFCNFLCSFMKHFGTPIVAKPLPSTKNRGEWGA